MRRAGRQIVVGLDTLTLIALAGEPATAIADTILDRVRGNERLLALHPIVLAEVLVEMARPLELEPELREQVVALLRQRLPRRSSGG